MSTEDLRAKYIDLHREFNNKRIPRRKRDALIPIAEALRIELARRNATFTVEELALALCDPIGDDAA